MNTVTLPDSLVIWLASLFTAGLGAFFTFCVHLLIKMNGTLTDMAKTDAEYKATIEARLESLERHDRANQAQGTLLTQFLKEHITTTGD
jgi:hypothetical protein